MTRSWKTLAALAAVAAASMAFAAPALAKPGSAACVYALTPADARAKAVADYTPDGSANSEGVFLPDSRVQALVDKPATAAKACDIPKSAQDEIVYGIISQLIQATHAPPLAALGVTDAKVRAAWTALPDADRAEFRRIVTTVRNRTADEQATMDRIIATGAAAVGLSDKIGKRLVAGYFSALVFEAEFDGAF